MSAKVTQGERCSAGVYVAGQIRPGRCARAGKVKENGQW